MARSHAFSAESRLLNIINDVPTSGFKGAAEVE